MGHGTRLTEVLTPRPPVELRGSGLYFRPLWGLIFAAGFGSDHASATVQLCDSGQILSLFEASVSPSVLLRVLNLKFAERFNVQFYLYGVFLGGPS